jgi:hypothetical protein
MTEAKNQTMRQVLVLKLEFSLFENSSVEILGHESMLETGNSNL